MRHPLGRAGRIDGFTILGVRGLLTRQDDNYD